MRVTGRNDDMLIIRGVNVYPSQIEAVLVGFPGIAPHYQIVLTRDGPLDAMTVEVELLADGAVGRPRLPGKADEVQPSPQIDDRRDLQRLPSKRPARCRARRARRCGSRICARRRNDRRPKRAKRRRNVYSTSVTS